MPINQLVNFCHNAITKNGKCAVCEYPCQNNCNECLRKCHNENLREYDCLNMIYCYTCSYIYKYASEIVHIFNIFKYQSFTEFNILNLGCGSCADLFGIDYFLTQEERNIPLSYTGVDINSRWSATQEEIKQIFPQYSINFILADVFMYLDSIKNIPFLLQNIVILQYILNELDKRCPQRLNEFITKFVENVVDKMPSNSTLILNDINHYNTRRWFSAIFVKSQEKNIVSVFKHRFVEPTSVPYVEDYRHYPKDNLFFPVLNLGHEIKSPCSSAQLILYKTSNK